MKLTQLIELIPCPKPVQAFRWAQLTLFIALACPGGLALWIVGTFGLISYEALALGIAFGGSVLIWIELRSSARTFKASPMDACCIC